jgi:acetoin utilization deacetylase AcuC-like enzyme
MCAFLGDMARLPVTYSEDFLTDYRTVSCESPDRACAIRSAIEDIADFVDPEPCTEEDLLRCHTRALVDTVEKDREILRVAKKAAGGAIRAAEIALERPSFALIRPPGHHAGRNFNGGFCFFNNMAIALNSLLSRDLITRALIVDIDLHYGNGTEDIVRDDARISFWNIDTSHREGFFADLEAALKTAPDYDMVGCSAGFDTYVHDWGGILFTDDYRKIAAMIMSSSRHFFTILEGGYYIEDLGQNAVSYLNGILEAHPVRSVLPK